MYSDHHHTIYNSEHRRCYKILINVFKCLDNTIIADFFPCAYLYGQSGVARDPHICDDRPLYITVPMGRNVAGW